MEDPIPEIEHLMAPILDGMQMRHLHAVLASCLSGGGSTSEAEPCTLDGSIDEFLSAKRLEGCSERSLGYYESTLRRFSGKMRKCASEVTTDDIRTYLSDYQETSGASNVTVDNIRRIISSFFSCSKSRTTSTRAR